MRMNHLLLSFLRNSRGSTLVEFALIMPILVLLVTGIFEICMFALLNNKLVRIAGTMSNVISMQNVTPAKIMAIINTSNEIAKPFDFKGKGEVIVSQIYNKGATTDPNNMSISWQQNSGTYPSKLGKVGTKPINVPNNLTVTSDMTIVVTEVYYNYTPYVFKSFVPSQTLYKTSVYVPRLGDMTTLLK